MKVLSRKFTFLEKVMLTLLSCFLLGYGYYHFVHEPVKSAVEQAQAQQQTLNMELEALSNQIRFMESMQSDLDGILASTKSARMESYNNTKAELKFMNDILENALLYTVTFDDVTRDGDLIRRNFTLRFTAADYSMAKELITSLYNSPYRCLIRDISMKAQNGNILTDLISVTLSATFYETMVGGTADAGLPVEKGDEIEGATVNQINYDL